MPVDQARADLAEELGGGIRLGQPVALVRVGEIAVAVAVDSADTEERQVLDLLLRQVGPDHQLLEQDLADQAARLVVAARLDEHSPERQQGTPNEPMRAPVER